MVAHAHGHALTFKHPAVQSACMFAGEFLCLLIYIAMQVGLLRYQCLLFSWLLVSDCAHPALDAHLAQSAKLVGEWSRAGMWHSCTKSNIVRTMQWRKKAPELEPLEQETQAARHSLRAILSFSLPACCDACATTLLNLGLYFTWVRRPLPPMPATCMLQNLFCMQAAIQEFHSMPPFWMLLHVVRSTRTKVHLVFFVCRFASTFQMLRGTLVIFAGLLTIALLKRRLHSHHWLGMVLITAGARNSTKLLAFSHRISLEPVPCTSADRRELPSQIRMFFTDTLSASSAHFSISDHITTSETLSGAALVGASSVIFDRQGRRPPPHHERRTNPGPTRRTLHFFEVSPPNSVLPEPIGCSSWLPLALL